MYQSPPAQKVIDNLKEQFKQAFVPETNRERALAQLWMEAKETQCHQ